MPIITDVSSILILAADNAWANYREAVGRARTANWPQNKLLLDAIARASLDQFFRRVEQDPRMLPYHLNQSGHWLDRRKAR